MPAAGHRLVGAAIAVVTGAVLTLASILTPSSAGLGTHEQLSLPACGWVAIAELPCPTCGMTTAFAHAADGRLLESFLTQPLGCALAVASAMALLLGVYVAVTGSSILGLLARSFTAKVAWSFGFLALLAWGYKVASFKGWF
jgi:hypothetical protein